MSYSVMMTNSAIAFWIDEDTRIVWVTGVVYNRRDRLSSLIDMPLQ